MKYKTEESMFVKAFSLFSITHCLNTVIVYLIKIVVLVLAVLTLLVVY